MATYSQSMVVKQFIQGFAGKNNGGVDTANYSDALLYTCPNTVLFARVWTLVTRINTVPGAPVASLRIKIKKPDINGALTIDQTSLYQAASSGPLLTRNFHDKIGPNVFDLNSYDQGAVGEIITIQSQIIMPGESLYADLINNRGLTEAAESCCARYLIMEVSK